LNNENDEFLVVDDDPNMCWALQHILDMQGYRSKIALSAQETLALITPGCFRLVFLDAKLPDMEGLELARRIREIDPAICIVMVSGYFYNDDIVVQNALEDGLICSFIAKPFLHHEIIKTIKTFPSPQSPLV